MDKCRVLFCGLLLVISPALGQTPAQTYNTNVWKSYCQPSNGNVRSAIEAFRPLCEGTHTVECCNNVAKLISSNPNSYLCSLNANGYTFTNDCKSSADSSIVFRDDSYDVSDTYYPRQKISSTANKQEYRPAQPIYTQTRAQSVTTPRPANGQSSYQGAPPVPTNTFQFNFGNPQDSIQVPIASPGSSQSNGFEQQSRQPPRLTQRPSNNVNSQSNTNGNTNDDDYGDIYEDDRLIIETGTAGYQATEFALNLFKNLDRPANGDTFISPLLPQVLLANLIDYATPVAKSELKQSVLLHPDQLASIVAKLEKISKSTVNTIEIASANFVAEDVKLNNTYSTDVRQRNVEVRRVDFSQPYLAARNANNWVSGKTHNLINEILNPSSVSPYTRLLLANTIYFKGMWKYTFIETNPGKFEASPNNPRQINKMFQLNKLRYGTLSFPDGNGLRWVELPYEGNRLAMLVFLPTIRHQLEASLRQLKPYDLAKVMAAMRTNYINTKVHLHMPKFTLTDSVSLIPALQRMGIHSIFQDQDALQYIANESTMVSDVTQRSYMSVDEFGTKATSVASLSIVTLSITPQFKDVQFDVDQPFLTMIVDKQERYPIFIGVIHDPRE